jgi:signal transduction histidine kinase
LVTLSLSINRLTQPLVQLGAQAAQLVPGSTFRPSQAQGPREVRQLIRAFNQMVIRLAKQQAALREYAVQVLESQESERRRVARDLHDETVQDLVGLMQRIELCRVSLEREPAATQLRLDELHTLAADALADVRRTVHDLRSPVLDDLGLGAAVDDLCAELRDLAPEIQVHYNHADVERRLPPEVELTCYRIVQEALTNVRRHARQATRVEVQLSYSAQGVTVSVADNGAGFVVPGLPALMRGGHLGLAGMLERARLIGARLSVESAEGRGTTVTLKL